MSDYDRWKATDEAANDADRRPQASPECEGGNHAGCDEAECDFTCACPCHAGEQ